MIAFEALGTPLTQGSVRAGYDAHGKLCVKHERGAELKRWRSTISTAARRAMGSEPIGERHVPITVQIEFRLPRPKNGRGGRVLGLDFPTQGNDLDKLARAAMDALSGAAFVDDEQVVSLTASKRYAADDELPGCTIRVARLSDLLSEAR